MHIMTKAELDTRRPEPRTDNHDAHDGDLSWLGALILMATGLSCLALLRWWGVYETIGLYLTCGALVGLLDALSGTRTWADLGKLCLALPALLVGLRLMGVGG